MTKDKYYISSNDGEMNYSIEGCNDISKAIEMGLAQHNEELIELEDDKYNNDDILTIEIREETPQMIKLWIEGMLERLIERAFDDIDRGWAEWEEERIKKELYGNDFVSFSKQRSWKEIQERINATGKPIEDEISQSITDIFKRHGVDFTTPCLHKVLTKEFRVKELLSKIKGGNND